MPILDFIIAGFAKCGTTSLYHYLKQHPELFLTVPKETNHFVKKDYLKFEDEYSARFNTAKIEQLKAEASVSYAESEFVEIAINRLHKHNANLKVVFIIRDPVRRIESQYRELHDSGFKLKVKCPFDLYEALLSMPNIIADTHYHRIINRYREKFSKSSIHVIFLEDLVAKTAETLRSALEFLMVEDQDFKFDLIDPSNQGSAKYRDTKLFRRLKNAHAAGILGTPIEHLSFEQRERLNRLQGWRVPFASDPVTWSKSAENLVLRGVREHSEKLLSELHRERAIWPAYERLYHSVSK